MVLSRDKLREYAIVGARERLVALELERQQLFGEFPELAEGVQRATVAALTSKPKPKDGRRKKVKVAKTKPANGNGEVTLEDVTAWLKEHEKPVRVIDVAEQLHIKLPRATHLIQMARSKGLVKSTPMKFDNRWGAVYELTAKGEKHEAPVNGVA